MKLAAFSFFFVLIVICGAIAAIPPSVYVKFTYDGKNLEESYYASLLICDNESISFGKPTDMPEIMKNYNQHDSNLDCTWHTAPIEYDINGQPYGLTAVLCNESSCLYFRQPFFKAERYAIYFPSSNRLFVSDNAPVQGSGISSLHINFTSDGSSQITEDYRNCGLYGCTDDWYGLKYYVLGGAALVIILILVALIVYIVKRNEKRVIKSKNKK